MKIQNISIGDSKINEYKLEGQNLTMILEDYNGTLYEIAIENCTFVHVIGSVGFSLSEGKFTKDDDGDRWRFYDEDGAVLELKFKGYSMRKI